MVKQGIKIFCRVKPTKSKTGLYDLEDEDDNGCAKLTFVVPRDLASGFINNKKEEYSFRFERVFDRLTKQDEVFQHVAQDVADNVLMGYNGTLFAYGQTGSGKTFTITGGAERFIDRGIIPRTLTYLFEQYPQNPDKVYTTHISYLEIYNEQGYDLLDPKHEAAKLEDLPKVSLLEDNDGNIHLKNLTLHQSNNEEEALNLLFLGDTNRMIAETPMNQASTRSHCIFTIHVASRESGNATIRRSKLHLVDLAGSERIGKTGVTGTLLKEAKYINLSLHYLEQVIVALSEKSRQHIPYRNSMMTSILRDSLGGNCMTSMIATCSVEKRSIDESISTCRFSQRVALIKNDALLNEELDPKLLIIRLKAEIQELKNQLGLTSGNQSTAALSEEELQRLHESVHQYVDDNDADAVLDVGADMRKINECFRIFKRIVLNKGPVQRVTRPEAQLETEERDVPGSSPIPEATDPDNIKKLKGLIHQRDNEINILVNMLKKEKKRAQDAINHLGASDHHTQQSFTSTSVSHDRQLTNGTGPAHSALRTSHQSEEVHNSYERLHDVSRESRSSEQENRPAESSSSSYQLNTNKRRLLGDMSVGRQEAFNIFRRDYPQNSTIDDNKRTLKERYGEAKGLGQRVNECRQTINKLKSQIEHRRLQLAMSRENDPDEPDEVEQRLRQDIEKEKESYKVTFNRLRVLKTEIEHLQHLLERSRLQLQKDFEIWWAEQAVNLQDSRSSLHTKVTPTPPTNPSKAWRTPPPLISQHKGLDGDHHIPLEDYNQESHRKHHHSNYYQSDPSSREQHDGVLSPSRPYSGSSRNAFMLGLGRQAEDEVYAGGIEVRKSRPPVPPIGKSNSSDGVRRMEESESKQSSQDVQSRKSKSSIAAGSHSTIHLTGDKRADADIMAFIKARQNLLQNRARSDIRTSIESQTTVNQDVLDKVQKQVNQQVS